MEGTQTEDVQEWTAVDDILASDKVNRRLDKSA
jgi:hypothetical protein